MGIILFLIESGILKVSDAIPDLTEPVLDFSWTLFKQDLLIFHYVLFTSDDDVCLLSSCLITGRVSCTTHISVTVN